MRTLNSCHLKTFFDFFLYGSSIESLGNLESVGGDLDLRWTPISKKYTKYKIRSMVNVGGNVYL